ncbi:S-methyl-5'-thioinosine phosphorylase [Bacterioplanoides sp.]|uniref:S-methyl-5'-thioinosine phosphorylase n=1 Tax=Bacterioplanoides sp. TaxID=2066072 RepID=UPI003B598749
MTKSTNGVSRFSSALKIYLINMKAKKIAIIGGTGLTQLPELDVISEQVVETPLGPTSGLLTEGKWQGKDIVFLARHGHPHSVPPHKINYRANLLALQQCGVDTIIAVNAVGGIHPLMGSGVIAVPHQIVDYTWGRESTFFDGEFKPLDHIDLTHPYDNQLRQVLIDSADSCDFSLQDFGVYGATQGPRLETIAEIDRMERDGCDLVGMTGMPEATLARELNIAYASLCLVVNPAAGKSDGEITMDEIRAVLAGGMDQVKQLLAVAIERLQ